MNLFKIHPELIAIHVPKTAGSTFKGILEEAYGWQLKHIYKFEDMHAWNNGLKYRCNKPLVKAVYGHIEAHPKWLEYYPKAKLIAWVRDPAERVISAYYHWMKAGKGQDDRQRAFLEKQPSLVEFVEAEEYQLTVNAYEVFLGRVASENYFFIGRTEYFDEDLAKLEKKLGKKLPYTGKQANVNAKKPDINTVEREKIQSLLKSEYELYEDLLSLHHKL